MADSQPVDLDALIAQLATPVENEGDAYYKAYVDNLPLATFTYKIPVEEKFTKNEGGLYEGIFRIPRCADILSNIQFNSVRLYTLKYMIDGVESPNDIETYACFAAPFTHASIKITFLEEPQDDDEFSFTAQAMLFNKTTRNKLLKGQLFTKYLEYDNGNAHIR